MSDKKLKYETIELEKLVPYVNNQKRHPTEQVEKIMGSIKEFGVINPIIVDKDNVIIAGHGRYEALKRLGYKEVSILRAEHLTPTQVKAYRIADNTLAELSPWDEELLKIDLEELDNIAFDMNILGFEKEELNDILDNFDDVMGSSDNEKINDVPEIDEENIVIKRGDLIELGEHRLLCGDSTNEEDVKRLMNGEKADMVFTDPPYNVAIKGKAGTIKNDDMESDKFYNFLLKVFKNYMKVVRNGAVIYVAHADTERVNFTKAFVDAGFKFSQVLIWAKQSATLSRQDYNWRHEPILYGWKEGANHYFCRDFTLTTIYDDVDYKKMNKDELIKEIKKLKNELKTSVAEYDRPTISELHPTMKPVELVSRFIFNSSQIGWIVLDLFGGAGSTLIACEILKRKSRLMELDEKYAQVIIQRWCDYTGIDEIKINGKKVKWSEYKNAN